MAKLRLLINTALNKETLRQKFERSVSSKYATVQSMAQFLEQIVSGGQMGGPPSVISSIQDYAVRASGTLTLTSVVATNACTVNGVTFTAIASGAGANQFNVGLTDAATAANLAAAINASVSALVAGYVTAAVTSTASSPAVVTVYSTDYGIYGNQTTITGTTNIVASGAKLTGGVADSGSKTYTF